MMLCGWNVCKKLDEEILIMLMEVFMVFFLFVFDFFVLDYGFLWDFSLYFLIF